MHFVRWICAASHGWNSQILFRGGSPSSQFVLRHSKCSSRDYESGSIIIKARQYVVLPWFHQPAFRQREGVLGAQGHFYRKELSCSDDAHCANDLHSDNAINSNEDPERIQVAKLTSKINKKTRHENRTSDCRWYRSRPSLGRCFEIWCNVTPDSAVKKAPFNHHHVQRMFVRYMVGGSVRAQG